MPGWRNRTFGVELEIATNVSQADACRKLNAKVSGVKFTNGSNFSGNYKRWDIRDDGSITAGFELVSPVLKGYKGLRELKKVCDGLKACGIEHDANNTTCGMHVHIGAKDIQKKGKAFARLILFYDNLEKQGLKKALPISRRNNPYCEDIPAKILAKARTGSCTRNDVIRVGGHDYCPSLNVCGHTQEIGTVEFRRGMATTEFDKIASWLMLHLIMVENCSKLRKKVGFDANLAAAGLTKDNKLKKWARSYLVNRKRKFSGQSHDLRSAPKIPKPQ